jgi:hypothetical protein
VAAFPRQLEDSRIRFEDVHLGELAATKTDDAKNQVVFVQHRSLAIYRAHNNQMQLNDD